MEKYQKKFIEKIEETKKCWIEKEVVTRDELYRFLHSIKGTAPTIGLDRLGSIAEEKNEPTRRRQYRKMVYDNVENIFT